MYLFLVLHQTWRPECPLYISLCMKTPCCTIWRTIRKTLQSFSTNDNKMSLTQSELCNHCFCFTWRINVSKQLSMLHYFTSSNWSSHQIFNRMLRCSNRTTLNFLLVLVHHECFTRIQDSLFALKKMITNLK